MQNSIHSANDILCESRRVPVSGENRLPHDLHRYRLVPSFWYPSQCPRFGRTGRNALPRSSEVRFPEHSYGYASKAPIRTCSLGSVSTVHLSFPIRKTGTSKSHGRMVSCFCSYMAVSLIGGQTSRNRQVSEPHLPTNESLSVIVGWPEYYSSDRYGLSPMCKSGSKNIRKHLLIYVYQSYQ